MQKMSSLFVRKLEAEAPEGHKRPRYLALNEYHEDADWVAAGEGVATRKWDGTACCIAQDGTFLRRHKKKWTPVVDGDPNAKWHLEIRDKFGIEYPPGTYELCGPRVQGNAEGFGFLMLVKHGDCIYPSAPRGFYALRAWLSEKNMEGLVWHHPDGRMIKIRKCDFGLARKP